MRQRPAEIEQRLQHAEAMLQRRRLQEAALAFEAAEIAGAPADRCAGGRWMAHMLSGNFTAAWRESDAIRRRGAPDPHRYWKGESLRGKPVILRSLHGYGDAVQFLRYVPRLRELVSHLTVQVAPALVEIAGCFDGVDQVTTWADETTTGDPTWEVQVEVTELPYLFRTELKDLPVATRYLHLPPGAERRAAQAISGAAPRIGVVWAAGEWNPQRSIPLSLLQPMLSQSAEFWSLQGGPAGLEWNTLLPAANLHVAASCRSGILRLAAAVSRMDLVITVDTLAAHLAGALGKPAWVLLQHAADWRWLAQGDTSPWYPSLRLFRQPEEGDWAQVASSVERALQRWLVHRDASVAA